MTNRPEWCPADVWADAVHRAGGEEFAYPATVDAIARAVMAERERCSKIAGSELRNTSMLMSNPPQSGAGWDIRNAINAGTPAP